MARVVADDSPVPVALHFDHRTNREVIPPGESRRLHGGDDRRIEVSAGRKTLRGLRNVVAEAHACGVAVEGEVGRGRRRGRPGGAARTRPSTLRPRRPWSFSGAPRSTSWPRRSAPPTGFTRSIRSSISKRCGGSTAPRPVRMVVHRRHVLPDEVLHELVCAGAAKIDAPPR